MSSPIFTLRKIENQPSWNTGMRPRTLLVAMILSGCAVGGLDDAAPSAGDTTASSKTAVSALQLALEYDDAKMLTMMLPLAESGATIQYGARTITRDNVAEVRKETERRLADHEREILSCGFPDLSGDYTASATSRCSRTQSWASLVREDKEGRVSISQDRFSVRIVHDAQVGGERFDHKMDGTVVEGTLVFRDALNSDFVFVGEVGRDQITVKPDADRVLAAWPNWVKAPSRKDLKKCVVTLLRR